VDPLIAGMRAHERDRDASRYERLEEIGHGGFAVVHRARDRKLGREVALKVMRDDVKVDPEGLARFRREAEAAARLSHPNIVTILDAGEDAGQMVIAMELVHGETLAHMLGARRVELRALVALLEKVARGVHHAHERGIIHRDLKPSNVLVTLAGEPKVADFGLAHLGGRDTALTKSGALLGTPLYMAPEQAEGRVGAITARTDVYALGAMLYEIISGRPPHVGDTAIEICRRILDEEPITPRRLNTRVSRDLEVVALVAIDKDPRRRYATAGAFADDLRRWLAGEPIVARPAGALTRAVKWVRRHPTRSAVAGLLALGLLVAALLRADSAMKTARDRTTALMAVKIATEKRDWESLARAWTQLEALGDPGAGRQAAQALQRAAEERAEKRAAELAQRAEEAERDYGRLKERLRELDRLIEDEMVRVENWSPPSEKARGWALMTERDRLADAEPAVEARVTGLWNSAMRARPGERSYARRLGDFLWSRMAEAEDAGDAVRSRRAAATLRRFAEDAGLADVLERLDAGGTVTLESDPPGAEVAVFRYETADDRTLVARPFARTGATLPAGSYLFILRARGCRDVRYPLSVGRGTKHEARVKLYTDDEIGRDFVYVPAGTFHFRSDSIVDDGPGLTGHPYVADFFISRLEVTANDYGAFLNDRSYHTLEQAARFAPRGLSGREGDRLWIEADLDGRPIVSISWHAAQAYGAWLTARARAAGEKVTYRLPTATEWQKAARGADPRAYPWGSMFDWTFAQGGRSRPAPHKLEKVGSYPRDESPYGVRDMSGSVSEWTSDGDENGRLVCGGSWVHTDARHMIATSLSQMGPDARDVYLGFRLVRERE